MAKKNKLEPAEFEPEGTLFGIATAMRAFQLVHFINKALYINLAASGDDLKISQSDSEESEYFPLYTYHDPELRTDFFLFPNSNGSSMVFPSLRQMNFFILLQGAAYEEHILSMISDIKKITGIQAVVRIDQNQLKNIAYFYADLDNYMSEKKLKDNINRPNF